MDRQEEQIAHELQIITPANLHKTAPKRRYTPNLSIRHPQVCSGQERRPAGCSHAASHTGVACSAATDAGQCVSVLSSYFQYHHRIRTHLSLDKDYPQPRPIQPPSAGKIVTFPEVSGLHHRYERRAARSQSVPTNRRSGSGVTDRCVFQPLCSRATVPIISIHFDRSQTSAKYRPAREFNRHHLQPDSQAKYIFEQGQALQRLPALLAVAITPSEPVAPARSRFSALIYRGAAWCSRSCRARTCTGSDISLYRSMISHKGGRGHGVGRHDLQAIMGDRSLPPDHVPS